MPNRYWSAFPETKIKGAGKVASIPPPGPKGTVKVSHPSWGKGVPKVKYHAKSSLY